MANPGSLSLMLKTHMAEGEHQLLQTVIDLCACMDVLTLWIHIIIISMIWIGQMAQQVKKITPKPSDSLDPCWGRGGLTLLNCPLTSVCPLWHTCLDQQIIFNSFKWDTRVGVNVNHIPLERLKFCFLGYYVQNMCTSSFVCLALWLGHICISINTSTCTNNTLVWAQYRFGYDCYTYNVGRCVNWF